MAGNFRRFASFVIAVGFLSMTPPTIPSVWAGDKKVVLSVADALASAEAKQKLDGSVAFYFGQTAHPPIKQSFGETVTNRKSNAFGKNDAETCYHVLLSALIALQEKAQSQGGDAVINIHSYYKKQDVSYDDRFECYVGFLMSGVTLKGDVVKLAR